MPRPSQAERNRAIAAAYRNGARLRDICEQFGVSIGTASNAVKAHGQALSPLGRACRSAVANRRKAQDPAFRQRLSESGKRAWAEGRGSGGRKKGDGKKLFFADDAQRKHYRKLREAIGVEAARMQMGFAL